MDIHIDAVSYTCIVCGTKWGGNTDIGSSGICIECFAKWAFKTYDCFGNYNKGCTTCKIINYCKEYYDKSARIPL